MAGGGISDLFGALGGGLSALAGQQPSSGGGGGGGSSGGNSGISPANAPSSAFTDPLVTAPAALTAGDPTGLGQQQPQQAPLQAPTFTSAPEKIQDRLPGGGINWTSPANLGATGGPPPADQQQPIQYLSPEARQAAMGGADPNSAQPITAQVGTVPGAVPGGSPATASGLTPEAEVAAGYRPPEATDADLQQAAEEQGRKQAPVGASSVSTEQQPQQPQQQNPQQQKQQNPLQTAGHFLQTMADRTPGPNPPGSQGGGRGGGINLIKALGDLITQGPAAFMQDLQGVANQASGYPPQDYTSQGAARGYGYGADQSSAQAAASPPTQQPSAPQPPTGSPEPQAAQAEQAVRAEIAAQEAARNPAAAAQARASAASPPPATAAQAAQPAPPPAVQRAALTTGPTGIGAAAQPIAQGEIQASPYSRHDAPPMRPSQPHVDVSPLRAETSNPQTVQRMAQMVSQEVSLKPGNTRAQIVQLETLRNRALYGIAGNGRYPDGTRAPTSLAQAGQTIHGPYSRAGYSGYYPDYSNQRVNPQQLEKFKREVYDVVFPPDGSPGSNLSDVGWGPMTGNASNDPRMGERGMVAKHQYLRGTQGYSMRKSGGDDYFREHVRPGDALPQPGGGTMTALEPQRLFGEFNFGQNPDLTGVVNETARMTPGGIPWQSWNRSSNVEQGNDPFLTPLRYPTAPTGVPENVVNDWRAGLQSPQRASLMAAQAGSNDIDPLLDQLAQQWAQQLMGGQVPMPRPRPR
jgi:hypothetical protein